MVRNVFKRSRALLASAIFVCALAAGAATPFVNTQTASAAACSASTWDNADAVNIVYFGLGPNGQNAQSYVNALKCYYAGNKSGHADSPTVKKDYNDVQTIMNFVGANASIVSGMNTQNTVMGTVYRNGDVKVGNTVVGRNAQVGARFSTTGAKHIPGTNAYMRDTDNSFQRATRQALVYMQNGKMVFAVMTECGNVVTATPPPAPPTPPEQPKLSMTCNQLTPVAGKVEANGDQTFQFVAKASVSNTTITSYTFNYGDGSAPQTVNTSALQSTGSHTYKPGTYKASVVVKGKNVPDSTGPACTADITVKPPTPPETPPTPPTPPTTPPTTPPVTPPAELPQTGVGSILGLFTGTAMTSAAAHRIVRNRRLSRD